MDLLKLTQIGIRTSVRSTIYKAVLQPHTIDTFGIILGTKDDEGIAPIFESALISCSSYDLVKIDKTISADLIRCSDRPEHNPRRIKAI